MTTEGIGGRTTWDPRPGRGRVSRVPVSHRAVGSLVVQEVTSDHILGYGSFSSQTFASTRGETRDSPPKGGFHPVPEPKTLSPV